jgi:hypothetical protein
MKKDKIRCREVEIAAREGKGPRIPFGLLFWVGRSNKKGCPPTKKNGDKT